ncbi:CHAP domain-containing protein [Micromonosporaceae bacterium Da 78-11]
MTNLPTATTETTSATRGRQLARVLAIGAFAAGAVVGVTVPAQAAPSFTGYHVAGADRTGSRVVTDPRSYYSGTVATLTNGTSVTIDCAVQTRRDGMWHHITSPVNGYVSDYYLDTPGYNQFLPGETTCYSGTPATTPTAPTPVIPSTPPNPSAPASVRGATINYNEGYAGSCVYYALDRFHQFTGVYPKAFGDARYLATGAAASGWTVSSLPRINSLVVFQPGQNGAGAPTGHVAWVEQVSGDRIYIAEMNAPTAYVVTHRWLTPVTGVRYVYA